MDKGYCIIEVLFDQADNPFDWRYIEANPPFEKHTGLTDIAGKTILELMPDIKPEWFGTFGRIVRTREPEWRETYSAVLDRWSDIYAFPVGEPESNRVAILLIDTSEHRQAQSTSARLAAIVETSEDAIISKDLSGTIRTWNTSAQRLFGYTAAEAVGQSVNLLIPSDRVDEEDTILERIRRGERIEHFETVRRRKNGGLFDVSLTISPIIDKTGRVTGASKITRDISERRRNERLREEQTRLLELIASDAPLEECLNRLCLAVPRISEGVRASILVADAARKSFRRPIAPELQPSWGDGLTSAPIDKLMVGTCGEAVFRGQPVLCEDVTTDERWSRQWRELCRANGVRAGYSVPVWDEHGEPVASFMLCFAEARGPATWERDLAEFGSRITSIALARTRANEALRAADQRKDEFLATLAHELRNPLAPLRNGLEIIRRNNPETTKKAQALMTRQIDQLTHLVDDLLDVSRITRGKIALRLMHTDLKAAVQDAVETTRPRVDAAGHTLHTVLPAEPITLRADRGRLTQVFINLITNASKYTRGHGRIELALEQCDHVAVVVVRDDGMGIAADKLADIFDIFSQAAQPEGRTNEGLGIGLTLARQVVELHGGTVEAQSEGLGRGAEFTVRLPMNAAEPVAAAAAIEEMPAVTPSDERLRLLVVDDNHDVADAMMLLLESLEHEVRVAYDGYQALDAVTTFQPDAVFLDLGLPGIDGLETARRMRAMPQLRHVALIALTGWGQASDRHRSAEAGFDRHLVKPVEPDVLEQLLAGIKAQDQSA